MIEIDNLIKNALKNKQTVEIKYKATQKEISNFINNLIKYD